LGRRGLGRREVQEVPMSDAERRPLRNPGKIFPTAKSCVPGELAYRPHPLEERGLAQRL
jgi:hypothetical protein